MLQHVYSRGEPTHECLEDHALCTLLLLLLLLLLHGGRRADLIISMLPTVQCTS
jgi:hypothetical protein